MEIITSPTYDDIKRSAIALKEGHLVAFPTETVYGLGADATNKKAVSRIYSVKGRPSDHPLIVHISSIEQVEKWAIEIPAYAMKLASDFWPGPMTLILKKSKLAKDFITGGQDNVGLRIPAQEIALSLLKEFENIGGSGISAPSANKFGAVSPTYAQAVVEEIGQDMSKQDILIDGGFCQIGIESTIIDCTSEMPAILRPGSISKDQIDCTGGLETRNTFSKVRIKAPGMLEAHYSPQAEVKLEGPVSIGDGFLALANIPTPEGAVRLGSPNTTEEFAKIMYKTLRLCDRLQIRRIIVIEPIGDGLAEAIRDRLYKSSKVRS